jgi:oligopeptide/dipeptide ABC transporter ATP-binding protein
MLVSASVGEPLELHQHLRGTKQRRRVQNLFERVGLGAHHLDRFPYELSGGQLQRVAVARAISTDPDLIVCDEAVAALDMSIRAQVINLLRDLQAERELAYVFITHDLSLVRLIAHRVAVMYKGRIVEIGTIDSVFGKPRHPYTQALVQAIPQPDPDRRRVGIDTPRAAGDDQQDLPGCDFADRCPLVMDVCWKQRPELRPASGVQVACHLYGEEGRPPSPN